MTANFEFVTFLKKSGFSQKFCDDDSIRYYVNRQGRQVKLSGGVITLLDKKGYVINYSNSLTESQINNFITDEDDN